MQGGVSAFASLIKYVSHGLKPVRTAAVFCGHCFCTYHSLSRLHLVIFVLGRSQMLSPSSGPKCAQEDRLWPYKAKLHLWEWWLSLHTVFTYFTNWRVTQKFMIRNCSLKGGIGNLSMKGVISRVQECLYRLLALCAQFWMDSSTEKLLRYSFIVRLCL